MALLLYLVIAGGLSFAVGRWLQPLSRAAAIALVLLPLCFTGRAMFTGRVYAPADLPFMADPLKSAARQFGIQKVHNGTLSDLYCQIIPWQKAVRHAWQNGDWPLLNPFMLCGDILAAAAQPAPYDPFNLASLLVPLPDALTFGAAITFFIAALSAFLFARAIGCRESAALFGAAAWMFSGSLAFFVGWPLARSWAYLPLVMFAVRLVVREASLRAWIVLTLAFVLLIVTGHPETLLHVVAIAGVYGIFELITTRRRTLAAAALALTSGLAAILLTLFFLLPFTEAAPQTYEHGVRTGVYATSIFPPMPAVTRARLGSTFLPFWGGQPWRDAPTSDFDPETARAGSIALALALAAVVAAPRRKETWFLLVLAVFSMWAGADALPVAGWLHSLPLFNIALNERFVFAAAFATSMLAAIALDSECRATAAVAAIVFIALACATYAFSGARVAAGVPATLIRIVAIAELVPLAIAAIVLAFRPRIGIPAVLALLLVQRVVVDGSIYPNVPRSAFYPEIPLLRAIPRPGAEPYRVSAAHFTLIPNGAALYELEDARGYEAMTNDRLRNTYSLWSTPQPISFNAIGELGKPFLSFLNIRYLVMPPGQVPQPPWKQIYSDTTGMIFENTDVLPRAFIPHEVEYVPTSFAALPPMQQAAEFRTRAWIEVPEYTRHVAPNGSGALAITRARNGLTLDARMQSAGWVVVSQTGWKGWRTYIDDRRVQWRYANHAFLGVYVPAGAHRVRVVYEPESFTRGRAISGATLALICAGIFVIRRRRT